MKSKPRNVGKTKATEPFSLPTELATEAPIVVPEPISVRPILRVSVEQPSCGSCGRPIVIPTEWSIDVEYNDNYFEVWVCDACGSNAKPTIAELTDAIMFRLSVGCSVWRTDGRIFEAK